MRRIVGSFAAALVLAMGGVAIGGEGELGGAASGAAGAGTGNGSAQVQSGTAAEVVAPAPDPSRIEARLKAVRDRAKRLAAKQRDAVEKQIASTTKNVDLEASAQGEATVSNRLAFEFNTTAEALVAQREEFEAGWGELMVAHTLLANAGEGLELDHLFQLRSEGLGWAQISHGLGIKPSSFASAVKSESLVAAGTAKADGKPARISSGTQATASTSTGVAAGQTTIGTSAAAGIGVSTKLGK